MRETNRTRAKLLLNRHLRRAPNMPRFIKQYCTLALTHCDKPRLHGATCEHVRHEAGNGSQRERVPPVAWLKTVFWRKPRYGRETVERCEPPMEPYTTSIMPYKTLQNPCAPLFPYRKPETLNAAEASRSQEGSRSKGFSMATGVSRS